jgi:outer membrane protein insertion porin family
MPNNQNFKQRKASRLSKVLLDCAIISTFFFHNNALATIVKKIQISGLSRIEEATVLAKMPIRIGDNVEQGNINTALKTLYQTRYFGNIQMDISSDGTLFVTLQENPIVNSIVFGGIPTKFSDAIKDELKLKVRGVYTKAAIKEDAEKIRLIFNKTGKINTVVVPKIEILDRNRVNVLFDISQGTSSRVDDIFFINNAYINSTKLKNILTNRGASAIFKFFRGKVFEADSLDVEKTTILRYYMNRGFADAAINYMLAEYYKEDRGFLLTFDINEGNVYHFGHVTIKSEVEDIKVTEVKDSLININPGDLYKNSLINRAVFEIGNYFANRGFAFVKVDPVIEKDVCLLYTSPSPRDH